MSIDSAIAYAADVIRKARRLTVLTGAGVSRESGIPTFRDSLEGIWAQFDPMKLATRDAFQHDPKLVWEFYHYRLSIVKEAQPNPGHLALAALEQRFPGYPLITQNIDSLHEAAGSTNVIHLHGQIHRSKCFNACQGDPTLIDVGALPDRDASPPKCPHCGAFVRPDVVWFGEYLPESALQAADAALHCDVLLVVGTSGVVAPASRMPYIASNRGADVIEVNPLRSDITQVVDCWIAAPSGEALPELIALLGADA
ncbi:MAG: NAD-dependent deacylase [bacterium]|nr:NAD-dependent deacylase [bacterium]